MEVIGSANCAVVVEHGVLRLGIMHLWGIRGLGIDERRLLWEKSFQRNIGLYVGFLLVSESVSLSELLDNFSVQCREINVWNSKVIK